MIGKMTISRYFIAIVAFVAAPANSAMRHSKAPRPFLFADIDGDGKKDGFYRKNLPKKQVELGVKLTAYHNKYVKIFSDNAKRFNSLKFGVSKRKKLISDIRCNDDCTDYRSNTVSMLERSRSPEVVDAYVEESSASVIFMTEQGRVTQEWYSD